MAWVDLESRSWRAPRGCLLWLAAGATLAVAPHAARVPAWLSATFAALVGWRVAHELGWLPRPSRLVRLLVTGLVPVGVFLTFGTLLGRDAGLGLLVALAALKILETESLRDAYVVVLLTAFLAVMSFLFSQGIALAAYTVVAVVVVVAALLAVNDRAGTLAPAARLRLAGALCLQAVPLTLVLFFLFPRLPGPLWGLPKDAHAGITRLGDTMSPGNISELSRSNAVAFRVAFAGAIPPASKLYWRGPVLWHTDGKTWKGLERPRFRRVPPDLLAERADPVDYRVTLEPHYERWLFALDMPALVPRGASISQDLQLLSLRPVRTLREYRMRSYTSYRAHRIDPGERRRALELPAGFHPRARALGERWRREASARGAGDAAIVGRALAHFRSEPFYYTLHPPLHAGDTVDEFLFLTRRGFCEFFAAAFTVLMRAAGIPSRVVTGYQGGDFNPIGGYFIVRQRDAHAWAEVWIEGRGWLRVDPTAAVAPDRIERGVDVALPPMLGPDALGFEATGDLGRWLRGLRHGWDAVDNAWNQWVIDYGSRRQERLLERLGLGGAEWKTLAVGTLGAGALALAGVMAWLARRARIRDRVLAAYLRFCAKLARRGLPRQAHEGPLDYQRRVAAARPDLADAARSITDLYLRARYARPAESPDPRALETAVASFRP